MFNSISISKKTIFLIIIVLALDQATKVWIKTHMMLGQEYHVIGNGFIIHFIENYGMAFGVEWGGRVGKIFLSLFRILAISGIGWYLYRLIKQNAKSGLILSLALIFAGATGNTLDGMFYGMLFNGSNGQVAAIFPTDGGYSAFLFGKVVDMFYFPIIHGHYPQWVPFLGSKDFLFFRDIFNIADSSIFSGFVLLLLFQKRFFAKK